MHNEQQDFERLIKLLSLKKFEKPKDGYFDDFSTRVISKIENENQQDQESWFINFVRTLIKRPSYAGGFALIVIALGFVIMSPIKGGDVQPNKDFTQNNPWELAQPSKLDPAMGDINRLSSINETQSSSTNPVVPNKKADSLFQEMPNIQKIIINPTPVSYP